MKVSTKSIVFAVIGGVVITLITGLINNTPEMLVGATWSGYPLAWLVTVVYPGSPWHIRPLRFVIDIVVWAIVVWIILFAVSKFRKK